MPVIELPAEPPLPGANTFFYPTFAAMLYPRNDRKREQWFAAAMIGSCHHWRLEGAPPEVVNDFHGWIGASWEFTQSPRRVHDDGIAQISRADLSGHLLIYLIRLARHHPKHCRLERAKSIVMQFSPSTGEGVSESLINKSWAQYKIASHLWAAFNSLIRSGWEPNTNEDTLKLLSRGERIRSEAERLRLLTPGKSWVPPENLASPVTDEIDFPPLEDDILAHLEGQFPS